MLTVFNRKKLIVDTSSGEIARVADILKRNKITYEVVTKRSQSAFGMGMRAQAGMRAGNGEAKTVQYGVGPVNFVYYVYVRGRDLPAAKALIN